MINFWIDQFTINIQYTNCDSIDAKFHRLFGIISSVIEIRNG